VFCCGCGGGGVGGGGGGGVVLWYWLGVADLGGSGRRSQNGTE